MTKQPKEGRGWAWMFQEFTAFGIREGAWVVCNWSEPSREALTARSKPTPDAVPVRVRLVPVVKRKRRAQGGSHGK